MNGKEITSYLKYNSITAPHFAGVISYEELLNISPEIILEKKIYIVNTDKLLGPGKHWTVIFMDAKHVEFFDSLGEPPEKYSPVIRDFLISVRPKYMYSRQRIQGKKPVCGNYCIFYAYFKCLNWKMTDFLSIFTSNCQKNDELVTF